MSILKDTVNRDLPKGILDDRKPLMTKLKSTKADPNAKFTYPATLIKNGHATADTLHEWN